MLIPTLPTRRYNNGNNSPTVVAHYYRCARVSLHAGSLFKFDFNQNFQKTKNAAKLISTPLLSGRVVDVHATRIPPRLVCTSETVDTRHRYCMQCFVRALVSFLSISYYFGLCHSLSILLSSHRIRQQPNCGHNAYRWFHLCAPLAAINSVRISNFCVGFTSCCHVANKKYLLSNPEQLLEKLPGSFSFSTFVFMFICSSVVYYYIDLISYSNINIFSQLYYYYYLAF